MAHFCPSYPCPICQPNLFPIDVLAEPQIRIIIREEIQKALEPIVKQLNDHQSTVDRHRIIG